MEGRLVDVALQGEVAEDLPGRLVALHLHRVGLDAAVVSFRAGRNHRGARHSLDVLHAGVMVSVHTHLQHHLKGMRSRVRVSEERGGKVRGGVGACIRSFVRAVNYQKQAEQHKPMKLRTS